MVHARLCVCPERLYAGKRRLPELVGFRRLSGTHGADSLPPRRPDKSNAAAQECAAAWIHSCKMARAVSSGVRPVTESFRVSSASYKGR